MHANRASMFFIVVHLHIFRDRVTDSSVTKFESLFTVRFGFAYFQLKYILNTNVRESICLLLK